MKEMKAFRGLQALCAVALLMLLLRDVSLLTPARPAGVIAAKAASEESNFNFTLFANLVQLTEAVLAPAWSTGGYAYALDGLAVNTTTTSLRPVCFHTRTSPSLVTAPFTFSMFDVQFSPLYLVAADNVSASAVGHLDPQRGCYVSLTDNNGTCMATLASDNAQCAFGSDDALHYNWTAALLTPAASVGAELSAITSLPASGLRGSELFAAFLNDFLPQRAWLRTVTSRPLDLLYTATKAADVFQRSTTLLTDADEVADMQRAAATEWNGYLWRVYGPQLRQKWDLFYRFAVATLTRGGVAPPLTINESADVTVNSITGPPGPVNATTCPLVDAWLLLRYNPDDINVTRFTRFMAAALEALADSLTGVRHYTSVDVAQTDALLFQLLRSTYCVTTTNLFALTALLDRPFLQAVASVWVAAANHSDSWAWQTMAMASTWTTETGALRDATDFQRFATAQVGILASSFSTAAETSFLSCVVRFLDPSTPLTSTTLVSPSDCVRAFVEKRDTSTGTAADSTALFELDTLSGVSLSGIVPGMTRYESTIVLPSSSVGEAAGASLQWMLVQESSRSLTAQISVFTPIVSSVVTPTDPCTTAKAQSLTLESGWDWIYECVAGTYVLESNATCATCPSACTVAAAAAAVSSSSFSSVAGVAVPVYCPGDGLLHGCPPRPLGAVFAGSTSGGQTRSSALCRYACVDVHAAPMNGSCLAVSGLFYNTSAAGNADVTNGGGLSSCAGPASLFPSSAPVRARTRLYAFVGSGATDAPLTCPFTLLHRATSSAVTRTALQMAGVVPPPPFLQAGTEEKEEEAAAATAVDGSAPAVSLPLVSRGGATWEAEVQLNATQLYEMHVALYQSLKEQEDDDGAPTSAGATTIAHELLSVHKMPAADDTSNTATEAARVAAWYLVSTFQHVNDGTESGATVASVRLQLLLNLSVSSSSTAISSTVTPTPVSLVVLSPSWQWSPWPDEASAVPLVTSTYRTVLDRQTNTVTFYVDGSTPLNAVPATVDWPLWTPTTTAASSNSGTGSDNNDDDTAADTSGACFFLSVGGWVAGYSASQQWILVSSSPSASQEPENVVLPLYYDYVPGMVTRVSSVASVSDDFQDILRAAEVIWQDQTAPTKAAAQGRYVMQLTSLADLAAYIAATPLVTSNISAALNALALRSTRGLDSVCRPGYGVLPTSHSNDVCEACVTGSYTVMDAAAGSNSCACVPQRVATVETAASTNQQSSVCRARGMGPAAPQAALSTANIFYVDTDVTEPENATAARIPLGWYAAAATAGNGDAVATTSLASSVMCTYGLTYPLTTLHSSNEDSFNTSVALRYATGLGGESCATRAAARGGVSPSSSASSASSLGAASTDSVTKPAYTDVRLYDVRLQAPVLTPAAITLENNSALYTDQTVLAVGVHDYNFLSFYAVDSLLQMPQLTEYHLSFLAHVLRSVTASAILDCGGDGTAQQKASTTRHLTWAGESALDTAVLWLNLTEAVKQDCVLTLRVTSAAAAARDAAVPFSSWPYSCLRVPPSIAPSTFFETSATLTYIIQAPSTAFTVQPKHNVLSEASSFVMAGCITLLSLVLAILRAIGSYAPTLDLLSWKRYELELAKAVSNEEGEG